MAAGRRSTFLNLRWGLWPQGAVLFALGVWAGEAGSLEDLTAWARRLGWTALAAAALLAALAGYEQARGQAESSLHGTGWPVMLLVVLYGIISVAVCAGPLSAIGRRRQTPFRGGYHGA